MNVILGLYPPSTLKRLVYMLADLAKIEIVDSAPDGLTLIKAAREKSADVLVLDVFGHHKLGTAFIEQLKREFSATILIILSNHSSVDYREKCLEAGANYFFDLSNQLNEFLSLLKELTLLRQKDDLH